MDRLVKPVFTSETIKAMEDMSLFTCSLIFDDLLIVAQKETNCFVLHTNDGLIIIDAIWPAQRHFEKVRLYAEHLYHWLRWISKILSSVSDNE